jgi:hypothetical protein
MYFLLGDILATCFLLVSYLDYSLTSKMEALCSSETPTDLKQNTLHITEVGTLHLPD